MDIIGETGTGGLLIIYAKDIINKGKIEANGKLGGSAIHAPGGSSGGGSVNLFYSDRLELNTESVEAKGGKAVMNDHSNDNLRHTGRSRRRWNSFI